MRREVSVAGMRCLEAVVCQRIGIEDEFVYCCSAGDGLYLGIELMDGEVNNAGRRPYSGMELIDEESLGGVGVEEMTDCGWMEMLTERRTMIGTKVSRPMRDYASAY